MKKILLIFSILLALAAPMRAQVLIMEEDENERNVFGNGQWNNIIVHGSPDDQANWVPLGSGALLLAALGGAYLTGRRRKEA